MRCQILACHVDEVSKALGYGKSVARVVDGCFQVAPKRKPAISLMRLRPAGHGTGDCQRGRDDALEGDLVETLGCKPFDACGGRSTAAAVQVPDLAGLAFVNEPKRIAADA